MLSALLCSSALLAPKPRPTLQELIGLNVHTVLFPAEQFKPIAKNLRNYHPFQWDVAKDTSFETPYPFAENKVNWKDLYQKWKDMGYRTSASVMFDEILPSNWKSFPGDAERYGRRFADYFGRQTDLMVEGIEIGNEPGKYTDSEYRTLFQTVAASVRKADPRLKIATCAMFDRASGDYHKSLETVKGLESLFDVVNLHSYAEAEPYPTWRRSYPEDPAIPFLRDIEQVIAWRNRHAPGKEVWLTEFGWDSTTQPNAKEGDFRQWQVNTDLQQAQWITRAFLQFSRMDLDRAYLFWFNDEDLPQLHGSSGLTRKGVPKPSFYAVAQLQKELGGYRFSRVVAERPGDVWCFEFKGPNGLAWAAWSPTGSGRTAEVTLPRPPGAVKRMEALALAPSASPRPAWKSLPTGGLRLSVTESPIFLFFGKE